MARDGLIHFACLSRAHCASRIPGLTQHRGDWALCPEIDAKDHDWYDIGGLSVRDAVTRWLSLIDDGVPTPA